MIVAIRPRPGDLHPPQERRRSRQGKAGPAQTEHQCRNGPGSSPRSGNGSKMGRSRRTETGAKSGTCRRRGQEDAFSPSLACLEGGGKGVEAKQEEVDAAPLIDCLSHALARQWTSVAKHTETQLFPISRG